LSRKLDIFLFAFLSLLVFSFYGVLPHRVASTASASEAERSIGRKILSPPPIFIPAVSK
jgi:hypothetical protein